MDKEELKKKFIAGNKQAFDRIYADYSKGMYSICLRYTKNQDEAADILQESFIKVYEKRSLFNPDFEIGPWVKRIVINEAINHLRFSKRFELIEDDNYFDEPEEAIEVNDLSAVKLILAEILRELPDGYRAVFNMYVIDHLSHQEIADYLGVSVNTSKTQLLKARRMIRAKLAEKNITQSRLLSAGGH